VPSATHKPLIFAATAHGVCLILCRSSIKSQPRRDATTYDEWESYVRKMSSWISWSLSCVIHLAMLLMLALLTIGSAIVPGAKLLLHFENADRSTSSDERLFEFSSALESASPNVDDDVVSTLEEPALLEDISSMADLALKPVDSTLDQEVSSGLPQDLYSVVSNLENVSTVAFSKRGGSQQGTAKGRGKGKGEEGSENATAAASEKSDSESKSHTSQATFFGTAVAGKKFIFVVDSSRSMTGARWRLATFELMRSLHELMSDTEFFVICFDETDHSVFNQGASKNFLVNDPKTLERTQRWIESLILGRGTFPRSALAKAVKMAPDAIFLLSDGVIQDDSIWMLRNFNHDKKTGQPIVPIHTILLLSPLGRQPLEMIANENGGTFKDITLEDLLPE
jgi:hypothetical protein